MNSESNYKCLFCLLFALFILQISIGLSIVLLCDYFKSIVDNHIYQIDKQQVLSIFFVIKLYGSHICFFFLCGLPIIFMFDQVYTKHLSFVIKLWLLLSFETVVGAIFMAWFFQNATQYMNDSFERSLTNGIRLYGTEPVWSLIWDDLQYNYKCCGVYSHTDWDKTPMYQEAINKVFFNDSVIPYSCAKNNLSPGTFLSDDNIYTEGCFTIISQNIKLMTTFMIFLNTSIIILQVKALIN